MNYRKRWSLICPFFLTIISTLFFCCHHIPGPREKGTEAVPAAGADDHPTTVTDLRGMLQYALDNGDKLNDSTKLAFVKLTDSVYGGNGYTPLWSANQRWLPAGDSLLSFIEGCPAYGLFPSDYHYSSLAFYRRVLRDDTLARKNPATWNRADILLTDAFFTLVKHLRQGRLASDSVTLRKDTVLLDSFYVRTLATARQFGVRGALDSLEPRIPGYDSLKAYLPEFLANAHFRKLTWLDYPYKDSAVFYSALTRRLQEVGYIDSSVTTADTAMLAAAVRKYQETNKLKVTGRASQETVTMMNNTDWEKFKRIAINLDRYKLLPDTLPRTYIWVSLPSFYLQVHDADTIALESRIIVGAPRTRTPLLTSEISNFVTYPQWTVPNSIIFKEMLPAIKRNVDYLRKQNLMVVDDNDSVRDPLTINWKRYSKNFFPFQLKQRQGDDNSLGVMKFNFKNKYDVYLHDTNVRWMFDNKFRAVSHGCVRVQQWRKLSAFLIRNDTMRYHPDTLKNWISRQEKHTIWGFAHVPIYLRYFTADGKKGKIVFYDDIYGEDRVARNRYFANKPIF